MGLGLDLWVVWGKGTGGGGHRKKGREDSKDCLACEELDHRILVVLKLDCAQFV